MSYSPFSLLICIYFIETKEGIKFLLLRVNYTLRLWLITVVSFCLQLCGACPLFQVITAQYFVWFFCLLPLILPWSNMKLRWVGISCMLVWMGAQSHWLFWGYMLEFKGKNVFLQLWLASLLFLAANTFVVVMLIRHHRCCPMFRRLEHSSSKKSEWANQCCWKFWGSLYCLG